MDPPLGLGLRDALYAVTARLEAKQTPGACAADPEGDLLESPHVALALAHQLELEPGGVAEAPVHAEQVGREQRGLVAAGAGPDLDDHARALVLGSR